MEDKPTYELITVTRPTTLASSWQELREIAEIFHKSGLAPDHFKTPEQVISACVVARDLGLPISTVLQGALNVINGVVSTDSKTMMALIMRANGEVQVNVEKDDKEGWVEVTMKRPSVGMIFTARWDEARVQKSRVNIDPKNKDEKWPWKLHRQTMKTWRAIAEAARIVAPDLIGGLYLADEVDVPVRVEGSEMVIEAAARKLSPVVGEGLQSGSTWPARPWKPETLWDYINKIKVPSGEGMGEMEFDPERLDFLYSGLSALLPDPGHQRVLLLYLFGEETMPDLSIAQYRALDSWMAMVPPDYKPSEHAIEEAKRIIQRSADDEE